MIIRAINCKIIFLVDVLSIMLYLTTQPQAVQTCRAATPHEAESNVASTAKNLSIYVTSTPIVASTLLDTLNRTPQPAPTTYLQHTVSSSTGNESFAYGHSSPGSGIARSCLDQSNEFYTMCFRRDIVRSPPLAVRYAGRSQKVEQNCKILALQELKKCQTKLSAAN